jgi:acyl-CoA reductase-like NAD-dependent aldehyde dehydrogenase
MQTVLQNASPEIEKFLSEDPVRMYIGGHWVVADDEDSFPVLDPGNGGVIAKVASGKERDVDRAVQAAGKAFRKAGWATIPPNDRAVILHRLADLMERNLETLAKLESLDVGKPLAQAKGFDIPDAIRTMRYYADLSVQTRKREPIAVSGFEARTLRVPYGVAAFIIPWNFPFLLLAWGISPALAAGNTVVVKPAEDTPLSTLFFCKLAEEAGIPPGVINVVPGFGETAGASLARHPGIQRMSFTGSPEVGRLIAEECGKNLVPVKLELGGKGAAVIFDDVNVDSAADALASAITLNSGQVCCTATRWLVQDKILDQFLARVIGDLKHVEEGIGYGLDSKTKMGPVVSKKQMNRVLGYLDKGDKGGATTLLQGGEVSVNGHEGGFYVKPALLSGPPDNVCAREEIFGPVAYVMPFGNEEEAIELVNRSHYGLANSVWSSNIERANRVAESLVAGNSWINAHNIFKQGIPYAGCNLSGLGGGVLGPDTLLDYLRPQSIVRPLG